MPIASSRSTVLCSLAVAIIAFALIGFASPAHGAGAEGEGWDSFNESDGCDAARVRAPRAAASGWFSRSVPVRGPWGDYFGRTIGAVDDALVWWDVPMSDGERLRLHERIVPGLDAAAANLAANQAAGRSYSIYRTYTFAYAPRTVGGSTKISQHAIGNALDINSKWNPYSSANKLTTNMPAWFVDSFTEAGFCWGGDWVDAKDAMHYSWQGPAFTPGMAPAPAYPPLSGRANFSSIAANIATPETLSADTVRLLAEGDGDAALDVVHLTQGTDRVHVDVSQARLGHRSCGVTRYLISGAVLDGSTVLYGDYDGRGGMELWFMTDDGGSAQFTVYDRHSDFEESTTFGTSVPFDETTAYLTGDFGGNGTVDLWTFSRDAGATTLDVWDRDSGFASTNLSIDTGLGDTTGMHFTFGDRDLDGLPDVFAVDPAGSLRILLSSSGYTTVDETLTIPALGDVLDVTASDYDGDGRDDLQVLRSDGHKLVLLGNSRIYSDLESWFETPGYRCDAGDLSYPYQGRFGDDEDNVHESDIEFIAEIGTTLGCNPPWNDRYCPERIITRGELSAFLTRTLGLTDDGGTDWFVDDRDSEFEGDINRLAAAGIAKGCNPPANDRFCPDRRLSREQMAAFIARAFNLTDTSGTDVFTDDNASGFENDIEALAFAGITLGCNPPANTRYCPTRAVPRDEMASFFARAVRYAAGS
ncbi:MAG: M15 family metallopeptidase [Acidimicrobiia bacterium]